ncbi:MAG TPA: hypothetical protein VGQ49_11215 [Bryobacteraceae bacterium]|jgi:hypothetical protein|nr:hypothetical protein [Bryobacteraceae bacterium]
MKLRCVFNELMRMHHRQGVLLGQTTASTPEDFFGFSHRQVAGIHFHKAGVGSGLWFRLRCGRVIDEAAMPARSDPDLYDRAAG